MNFNEIKKQTDDCYINVFNRQPVCLEKGKGAVVFDTDGKEYVDFLGGIAVNIFGHGDKDIVKAVSGQAKKLIHVSNIYYNLPQAKLCKTLVDASGFDKVFICNSGAEANEAAIKLVRRYNKDKYKIVTAVNSFHGRTLATLTATGQEKYSKPYAPLPQGFCYAPLNDINALQQAVKDETVGAVMLETIQGEGGVIPCTAEYLKAAEKLCREKGLLFMLDEIQTGMGRCGTLFSFQKFGINPDVITLAKGLGGGVPIGAMLVKGKAAQAFGAGDHGSTFGGNPLACAAANAVMDKLLNTDILAQVNEKGAYFKKALKKIKSPAVKAVRGEGLLLGLQLCDTIKGADVVSAMLKKGFIINCAAQNTLRFAPPYVITKKQIAAMVSALAETIENLKLKT